MDSVGYGWVYGPVGLEPLPGWTGPVFGRIDDVVSPWIAAKPANTDQQEAEDVPSADNPEDNDMGAQEDDGNDEDWKDVDSDEGDVMSNADPTPQKPCENGQHDHHRPHDASRPVFEDELRLPTRRSSSV